LTRQPDDTTIAPVQIHEADRVELTVMLDKADYRRIARDFGRPRRWLNLLLLPIPVGAFVSLAAEQLIGAATSALSILLLLIFGLVNRRRQVSALPDWAFGPMTFRVTAAGVEVESAVARRSVRWLAVGGHRKTPVAYWITVARGTGFALARRMLTERDEAALDAILARYCPCRTGEPSPRPTVRAASPGDQG